VCTYPSVAESATVLVARQCARLAQRVAHTSATCNAAWLQRRGARVGMCYGTCGRAAGDALVVAVLCRLARVKQAPHTLPSLFVGDRVVAYAIVPPQTDRVTLCASLAAQRVRIVLHCDGDSFKVGDSAVRRVYLQKHHRCMATHCIDSRHVLKFASLKALTMLALTVIAF
jgi:hypothetical protein